MGCRCSALCEETLPVAEKPVGHLSVTTPHGMLIPVRFFNVKHNFTVIMSGVSIKALTPDVRSLAGSFSKGLHCNLMAFWTETPRKGALVDFESVLWFVQSCTRQSRSQIVVYANDEEAGDSLRLCSRYPEIGGLVISLTRSGTDALRTALKVMAKLDPILCPLLIFHSLPEPPTSLLEKSVFYRSSARRRLQRVAKSVESEELETEVLKHLSAFLQVVRDSHYEC